ncbi:MAG: 5-formyltetrahydrofolate cyclo-ligase [Myxococcota bacterium]
MGDVEPVEARKRALRHAARRLRDDPAASNAVQGHVLRLPELERASRVALYAALAGEPSTDCIAEALASRGVELFLPRVADRVLHLARVDSLAGLQPGYRGILEPPRDAPEAAPDRVDVFLVPGLLFDRAGRRLGRGGGLYDRLLARARPDALRVGLCYAHRVVGELPAAPWDVRMHLVVSETGVLRPADPGAEEGP